MLSFLSHLFSSLSPETISVLGVICFVTTICVTALVAITVISKRLSKEQRRHLASLASTSAQQISDIYNDTASVCRTALLAFAKRTTPLTLTIGYVLTKFIYFMAMASYLTALIIVLIALASGWSSLGISLVSVIVTLLFSWYSVRMILRTVTVGTFVSDYKSMLRHVLNWYPSLGAGDTLYRVACRVTAITLPITLIGFIGLPLKAFVTFINTYSGDLFVGVITLIVSAWVARHSIGLFNKWVSVASRHFIRAAQFPELLPYLKDHYPFDDEPLTKAFCEGIAVEDNVSVTSADYHVSFVDNTYGYKNESSLSVNITFKGDTFVLGTYRTEPLYYYDLDLTEPKVAKRYERSKEKLWETPLFDTDPTQSVSVTSQHHTDNEVVVEVTDTPSDTINDIPKEGIVGKQSHTPTQPKARHYGLFVNHLKPTDDDRDDTSTT